MPAVRAMAGAFGLGLWVLLCVSCAVAGEPVAAQTEATPATTGLALYGPHARSDAVRARRAEIDRAAVRLSVERSAPDGTARGASHLVLGDGYVRVDRAGARTLYDVTLRRVLRFADGGATVANDSLYALIAAKRLRFDRAMAAVASADGTAPDPWAVFSIASDTGFLRDKAADRVASVSWQRQGATLTGRVRGETVVTVTYGEAGLAPRHRAMLRRYLAYELPLAPALVSRIVADEAMPTQIRYRTFTSDAGGMAQWRVTGRATIEQDYPLPAGLAADWSVSSDALRPLVEQLVGLVGDGKRPWIDPASLLPSIEAAAERGDWLGVFLIASQTQIPYRVDCNGPATVPACRALIRWQNRAQTNDPRVATLRRAMTRPAQNRAVLADSVQAVAAIYEAMAADAPHRPRVGLTLARLGWRLQQRIAAAGVTDDNARNDDLGGSALPPDLSFDRLFAAALAADPHNANLYRDYGDFHLLSGRPDLAWRLFDLGRAIVPSGRWVRLENVKDAEKGFRRTYPGFF
ncbi:hypothetical protein [Rhodothalassium salexigens]|uniref:hypothetical protein n=1 Tax=Rhodothalassium salexigens TaxID=1086 RepID=UPI00191499FA|nr:hypothetical protein [Rhodothalassium salexigens]